MSLLASLESFKSPSYAAVAAVESAYPFIGYPSLPIINFALI
jgi:hypothetical protein